MDHLYHISHEIAMFPNFCRSFASAEAADPPGHRGLLAPRAATAGDGWGGCASLGVGGGSKREPGRAMLGEEVAFFMVYYCLLWMMMMMMMTIIII